MAVGMVYAAELAHLTGHIDQDLVDYHRSLLTSLGLPTSWNGGLFDDVLALMHRDKKARGNELRFVVLDSIGHVFISITRPPMPWKKPSAVSSNKSEQPSAPGSPQSRYASQLPSGGEPEKTLAPLLRGAVSEAD